MDQKIKLTLADCYSQISEIWLSTAKIARGKLESAFSKHADVEFWEAFERRCCIRAGYYARLAEQHTAKGDGPMTLDEIKAWETNHPVRLEQKKRPKS